MPDRGHVTTQESPRTVTDYQLAIDYFGAMSGQPGTVIQHVGVVSEEEALAAAREALAKDSIIWRVEIWSRQIPVEWTKVEEIRREQ